MFLTLCRYPSGQDRTFRSAEALGLWNLNQRLQVLASTLEFNIAPSAAWFGWNIFSVCVGESMLHCKNILMRQALVGSVGISTVYAWVIPYFTARIS